MAPKNIGKGYISKKRISLGALDIAVRLGNIKSKIKMWKIMKNRQNPIKTLLFAISMVIIRLSLTINKGGLKFSFYE